MLPKIETPIYKLTIPLTKKKITFRPFLVKEEKILLMAVESNDEDSILTAIKQIIKNCVVEDINIDSLPMADLEFVFLNLRARSIGETIELQYKCNNKVGATLVPCGNVIKYEVNILDIKPEIKETHTNKIELTDSLGIVFKYPSLEMYHELNKEKSEFELLLDIIINSIEFIYNDDSIFYPKDTTQEELKEFIENLSKKQFEKVQEFFNTIPKISTKIKFECSKCGYCEEIIVEGMQNFF